MTHESRCGCRRTIKIHCLMRDGSLSVVSSDTGAYWPFNVLYVWFASQLPDDNCQDAELAGEIDDRSQVPFRHAREADLEMPCVGVDIFVVLV